MPPAGVDIPISVNYVFPSVTRKYLEKLKTTEYIPRIKVEPTTNNLSLMDASKAYNQQLEKLWVLDGEILETINKDMYISREVHVLIKQRQAILDLMVDFDNLATALAIKHLKT